MRLIETPDLVRPALSRLRRFLARLRQIPGPSSSCLGWAPYSPPIAIIPEPGGWLKGKVCRGKVCRQRAAFGGLRLATPAWAPPSMSRRHLSLIWDAWIGQSDGAHPDGICAGWGVLALAACRRSRVVRVIEGEDHLAADGVLHARLPCGGTEWGHGRAAARGCRLGLAGDGALAGIAG